MLNVFTLARGLFNEYNKSSTSAVSSRDLCWENKIDKRKSLLTTIQFFGIIITTLENAPSQSQKPPKKSSSLFMAKKTKIYSSSNAVVQYLQGEVLLDRPSIRKQQQQQKERSHQKN